MTAGLQRNKTEQLGRLAAAFQSRLSQNPKRARPTQLSANIELAIAVIETKVFNALTGCMTKLQFLQ
jgi:hypothetical protein